MRSQPVPANRKPATGIRIPPEGEHGLFAESWFPLCRSDQVTSAAPAGFDFLDGRWLGFREQGLEVVIDMEEQVDFNEIESANSNIIEEVLKCC